MLDLCQFEVRGGMQICRNCGRKFAVGKRVRARCLKTRLDVATMRSRPPCIFLGAQTGLRDCPSCRGNVRVKEFACHEPKHVVAGRPTTTHAECLRCVDYRGASHRLLLRFWHGLGDHIQLGVVLNHIRTLYPQWQVDLACHPDKADGLFHAQLCRTVHPVGIRPKEGDYDAVRSLFFPDPEESYAEVPSTKAERCLREVFNIEPRVELCHYLCGSSPDQIARAKQFATRFSPFVLCHATGHSVRRSKDLSIDAVAAAARAACGRKRHFFLLDLDERGGWDNDEQIIPIRNSADVWGGHGATSGQLAALAREADLCIAIDSGPGKVFASTGAHTITVWSGMHPLHYHGVAQNVFHLVPNNHERFLRGDIDVARNAFRRLFAHRVMERNVADELVAAVTERLLPC